MLILNPLHLGRARSSELSRIRRTSTPAHHPVRRFRIFVLLAIALLALAAERSFAASSRGCVGGGFTFLGLSGDQRGSIPAAGVPSSFLVKGKYVEFTVDAATFGVRDWTFTGAANEIDITGGRRTPVFTSKMPDHRGIVLNGDVTVDSSGEALVLTRTGPGLTMKIQAKDCANGGLFQMEVERTDGTATVFTHILADGVFYYDNPNVRDRLGERLPCSGVLPDGTLVECNGANPDGTVTVTARVNFSNDLSDKFVGRDSPQVATRIATGCPNNIPNPFHPGSVNHCGGISQWSVASGGRMGQVMGEDAVEIAPAATACVQNCQAQNQVNGRAVVVGFPFPVPAAVRLQPRFGGTTTGQLAGFTLSSSSVTGGTPVQGTVSLDAPAPAGGLVVALSSSNSAVVSIPASATIPVGAVSATFNAATSSVSSSTVVTLSGSAGGVTKTATLGVNAATPTPPPNADSVSVTRSEYTVSRRQLRVEATSNNSSATLTAYVTSSGALLGTLTNNGGGSYRAELNVATNPVNVTVRSSRGGSATRAVTLK
jgi:hypothetical protein